MPPLEQHLQRVAEAVKLLLQRLAGVGDDTKAGAADAGTAASGNQGSAKPRFCIHCGAPYVAGNRFCTGCGKSSPA